MSLLPSLLMLASLLAFDVVGTEGACPDPTSLMGSCVDLCLTDADCGGTKLCCSNGCGHVCLEIGSDQEGEVGEAHMLEEPYPVKPGECPDVSGMMGICVEQCSDDASCEGSQKCCSNGCGHVCMEPVMIQAEGEEEEEDEEDEEAKEKVEPEGVLGTEGTCPDPTSLMGSCVDLCLTDADCGGTKLCCSNGCGHVCLEIGSDQEGEVGEGHTQEEPYPGEVGEGHTQEEPYPVKPGECPDVSGMMGICVEQCSDDASCEGSQKCCSNGCGHVCMEPVMIQAEGEEEIDEEVKEEVEPEPVLEKSGECPDVSGMMGICVEQCSDDASCEGSQKCCSNGCGHVCMEPVMIQAEGEEEEEDEEDEEAKEEVEPEGVLGAIDPCEPNPCSKSERCEKIDVPCLTPPCPVSARCVDVCSLPKDTGECSKRESMYYYEPEISECIAFEACETGNYNRFMTLEECQETCERESVCPELYECPLKTKNTCELAKDAEGCEICECADPCYVRECPKGFHFECKPDPECQYENCKAVGTCVQDDEPFDPCKPNPCNDTQICVPEEVMCFEAPCNPVAKCIDCSPVRCRMHCEFGWVKDELGCEICQCAPNPCESKSCGINERCQVAADTKAPICVEMLPPGTCRMDPIMLCDETVLKWRYSLEKQSCEPYQGCASTPGNNFDSEVDCQTKCVGPAVDCPSVMCMMFCPYGFVGDDNGCAVCKCYDPCQNVDCGPGMVCEAIASNHTVLAVETGTHECRGCPPVRCRMYCRFGWAKGEDGCDICQCAPDPCEDLKCESNEKCELSDDGKTAVCTACPPVMCRMYCQFGWAKGEDGCDICQCAPHPCELKECGENEKCELAEDGLTAVCTQCPPVLCRMYCQFGWAKGDDGCPFCHCAPHPCEDHQCNLNEKCELADDKRTPVCIACPPVMCRMHCEFGWARGEDGCEFCQCAPNPCETHKCEENEKCELAPDGRTPICVAFSPPGSCQLDSIVNCEDTVTKWHYSTKSGQCEPYQGCDGSPGNNFDSMEDCERKCVSLAADCSSPACMMYCPYGFLADDDGCAMCKCYDPCQYVECGEGKTCQSYPQQSSDLFPVESGTYKCEDCPPLMCKLPCQFGYVEENGCEVCKCKDPCQENSCPESQVCIATSATEFTCRCAPNLDCVLKCEFGFEKDESGCDKCECILHPCDKPGSCDINEMCIPTVGLEYKCSYICPEPMCLEVCLDGYKRDEHGCLTCECEEPCKDVTCPSGQVCVVADQECGEDYCPKTAVCSDLSCEEKSMEAMVALFINPCASVFMPRCDKDGLYLPLQCNESIGQCWCVDRGTGTPKPGTRRNGIAKCTDDTEIYEEWDEPVCLDDSPIQSCSPLLCVGQTCHSADGSRAMCRINPCGSCSVEFIDPATNRRVECMSRRSEQDTNNNATRCENEVSNFQERITKNCGREQYELLKYWLNRPDYAVTMDTSKTAMTTPMTTQFKPWLVSTKRPSYIRPEITDTTTTTMKPLPTRSASVEAPLLPFVSLPYCQPDGRYDYKQCHGEVCWCVNEEGIPIESTMTIGELTCTAEGRDLYRSTGSPLICANGVVPYPCPNQCATAVCNSRDNDLTCFADPCHNCQLTFVNRLGQKVECYDQNKCSWVKDTDWYHDEETNNCKQAGNIRDCINLQIFEKQHECLIHLARVTRKQCYDDPCSDATCPGNPTAECVTDINCKPQFIDIRDGRVVDCGKVTGICARYQAMHIRNYLGSRSVGGFDIPDMPSCDADGNYAPQQCKSNSKECWCVEKNGIEIPDSHVFLEENQRMECRQLEPIRIKGKMVLNGNYNSVMTNKETFTRAFVNELANFMGIAKQRIKVTKISRGSVVVQYEISVEDDASKLIAHEDYLSSEKESFVVEYNGNRMPLERSEYSLDYQPTPAKTVQVTMSPGYIALICICLLLLFVIVFGFYMLCRFKEKKEMEKRWKEYNWRISQISKQGLTSSRASTSSGAPSLPEKQPDYDAEMSSPSYVNASYTHCGEVIEVNSTVAKIEQEPYPQDSKA